MAHTHYRTKGIVLGVVNKGEADQLFTVFTEDFGKIKVLGRAIRKIKSKLRSSIDLFYYSEIEFICGRNYKTLTDAILIKKIGVNLESFEIISQFAKVVVTLVPKEHKDTKIWHLLQNVRRSDLLKTQGGLTSTFFIWRLYDILGYKPQLYNCAFCHQKLNPEKLFFSPEHGGIICEQCRGEDKLCQEIFIDSIKILRLVLARPLQDIGKIKITPVILENLSQISEFYLQHLTGK